MKSTTRISARAGARTGRCWIAAALWLAALWPSAASADATPAPKSAAQATHEALVDAVAYFRAGRFDEARDAYARAYALDPDPETLLELGVTEFKGGHPVEAAEHFRQYLARRDVPADKTALVRSHWVPLAEEHIAHLTIRVPVGAEVDIDGAPPPVAPVAAGGPSPAGETLLSIEVRDGGHEIAAHRGAARQVRYVVAPGGQRFEIRFVGLDGSEPPLGSPAPSRDRPGDPPPTDRSSKPAAKNVAIIALGSAAVVSAGIAALFHVTFLQNSSDVNALSQTLGPSGCAVASPPADCGQLHHDRDAQRASAALADGFGVGAAVAAVAALGTWLLWPSHARSPSGGSVRVEPAVSTRQAGMLLTEAW